MSKNINKVAKHLLEKFEVKTKACGEKIIICHSNSHLQDFIQEVHGELLPDNFIYQTIYNCIESVANGSSTVSAAFEEMTPDTNIYDLTEWSISVPSRIHRINNILPEYHGDNYTELLQIAQTSELESICIQTISYLEMLSD